MSIFRNGIIEKIVMKMPLYGLSVSFVNPKGTSSSKANMMLQKKYRVDKHIASAMLIAMRSLNIKGL